MKLSDQPVGDVFLIIMKGEQGTGKTIAMASFAALGPMYIFDFEDRMRSVITYYRRIGRQDIIDNIEFDTFYSFKKVRDKILELQGPKGKRFKTIGWDSLTSFANRVLSNTKQFTATQKNDQGGVRGKTIGEFRVNIMEDFNAETAAINEFVVEHALIFKAMKMNFILTAHVIKVKEESDEGSTHMARYLLTGGKKAAQIVPGYYDEVLHFNIDPAISVGGDPEYTVVTRHSRLDFAKTSVGLPAKINFSNKVFYEEFIKNVKAYNPVAKKDEKTGLIMPLTTTDSAVNAERDEP